MASSTRIPKAELTGIYGGLVKRMSRKMLGDVAEPVEVAWHNRKVLNFSFARRPQGAEVGRVRREPEVVRPHGRGALVGCSFCLDLGYFMAHNEGLDEAKAREVPRWRESDVFTPLERDVMEYAEAMSQTPPTVTDEMSRAAARRARRAGAGGADRLHRAGEPVQPQQHRARHRVAGVRRRRCDLAPARRHQLDGMSDDPFVTHRSLLFTVAYEMLGSAADAEDVVQETWLRWADVDRRRGARPARRTWSGSSPGRRSTGCGRWPGGARSTSGSGCPSRC